MTNVGTLPATASVKRAVPDWLQVLAAFLAGLSLYVSLYGELPYHDVARFARQIRSGQFVWDIAHIFLQPATLLWHQYLGFGEPAEVSQKHINSVMTAAGLAVFYLLLLRLKVPVLSRIMATALVAVTASLMTLAPSGHMKLLTFPFLNGAILLSVLWEFGLAKGQLPKDRMLWGAAVLLAVASAFLASCLAAPPFVGLAIFLASQRAGDRWPTALWRAFLFCAICGVTFLLLASFGYVTFAHQPLSLEGLSHSVALKANIKPGFTSVPDSIAREIFGIGNNFIAAPAIGSALRAWIAGYIPSLRPYAGAILTQIGPWFAIFALVVTIYLYSLRRLLAGAPGLVPFGFLCGGIAWTIYYNLVDPEHWFALTVPTLLLFLIEFPERITRIVVPVWAVVTAAVNLAVIGIPVATFPLRTSEAEIRLRYTPNDLLVDFAAYPGSAYLGFFQLPGMNDLHLDIDYKAAGSADALLSGVDNAMRQTWDRGGKVVVFDVLDPYNWNAPWFKLISAGLTKKKLTDFFMNNYSVMPLGEVAHLKAWEIRPRKPQS